MGAVGRDREGGVGRGAGGLGGVEDQQHGGGQAEEDVAVAGAGDLGQAEEGAVEGLGGVEVGGVEGGLEDRGRGWTFAHGFKG